MTIRKIIPWQSVLTLADITDVVVVALATFIDVVVVVVIVVAVIVLYAVVVAEIIDGKTGPWGLLGGSWDWIPYSKYWNKYSNKIIKYFPVKN